MPTTKEADVLNLIRMQKATQGVTVWRNNVGATYNSEGRLIRYGLLNESKLLNERFKSADLIGVSPVTITQKDVGKTIGVFTAIEVKNANWKFSLKTPRVAAQAAFLKLVRDMGGVAYFTNGAEEFTPEGNLIFKEEENA